MRSSFQRAASLIFVLTFFWNPTLAGLAQTELDLAQRAEIDCPDEFYPFNDYFCIDLAGEKIVFLKSEKTWMATESVWAVDGKILADSRKPDSRYRRVVALRELAKIHGWDPVLQSPFVNFKRGVIQNFAPPARRISHECPAGTFVVADHHRSCQGDANPIAYIAQTGESGKVIARSGNDLLLEFSPSTRRPINPHWVQFNDLAEVSAPRSPAPKSVRILCPKGSLPREQIFCEAPNGIRTAYLVQSRTPATFLRAAPSPEKEILVRYSHSEWDQWLSRAYFLDVVAPEVRPR